MVSFTLSAPSVLSVSQPLPLSESLQESVWLPPTSKLPLAVPPVIVKSTMKDTPAVTVAGPGMTTVSPGSTSSWCRPPPA